MAVTMRIMQKTTEVDCCWGDSDVYLVSDLEMIAIMKPATLISSGSMVLWMWKSFKNEPTKD